MDTLKLVYTIFGFVFGTIFGSFINAAVYRIKYQVPFSNQRSMCPNCKHNIAWYDLIPILSYILLKGKCRNCSQTISIHYPIFEFITGLFGGFLTYAFIKGAFDPIEFVLVFIVLIAYMLIFVSDILYREIFDQAQIIALVGFLGLVIYSGQNIIFSLISAILASGFFYIIFRVAGDEKFGFGDVKMVFGIGLYFHVLGFFWITMVASFIGIFIGVFMAKLGSEDIRKVKVPLGSIVAVVTLFFIILERLVLTDFFIRLDQVFL